MNHSCFPQDLFGWILFYTTREIQAVQTQLTTVFLKLRISYQLPAVNQEIHSVFFPLRRTMNSQPSLQSVVLNSVIHFRRWNFFVEMHKSVFQISDFMLGYVFFLGLRRRSRSANEPHKYTSWCAPFRGFLVMNLSSHCVDSVSDIQWMQKFSSHSIQLKCEKFVYFERRGEILKF
jgi:hypothetical protein